MAKEKKHDAGSDDDTLAFTRFALKLWNDGNQLRLIREKLGLSKTEFAKKAGITIQRLNGYERCGQMAGNFWLFCSDLQTVSLDPRFWDDPDHWAKFLHDDDDLMGGPDNRFGKPKKFWRWAEDEKKDEMSRRTGNPIARDDVEKWYKQWLDEDKPDGWGREMSKPLDSENEKRKSTSNKAEKRKLRKAELAKLTVDQLNEIRPYKKHEVGPIKSDQGSPKKISKSEMIETILREEGLGGT